MKSGKFLVLNSMIDLIFALDILVNFRTTYYDRES